MFLTRFIYGLVFAKIAFSFKQIEIVNSTLSRNNTMNSI